MSNLLRRVVVVIYLKFFKSNYQPINIYLYCRQNLQDLIMRRDRPLLCKMQTFHAISTK